MGKCGKCPGNQFIATQLTRKFWEKKVWNLIKDDWFVYFYRNMKKNILFLKDFLKKILLDYWKFEFILLVKEISNEYFY